MGVERHRFLSSLRSVGESLERSAGSFDYEIDGGTAYQMALELPEGQRPLPVRDLMIKFTLIE